MRIAAARGTYPGATGRGMAGRDAPLGSRAKMRPAEARYQPRSALSAACSLSAIFWWVFKLG